MQCMNMIKDLIDERNTLKVDAATVICLRYKKDEDEVKFQVLLGQNECKNFLKSTNETNVIMRYPGLLLLLLLLLIIIIIINIH